MNALLLLLPATALADWPLGTEIAPSVTLDVTEQGFDSLAAGASAFIPPEIEIPDQNLSGGDGGFLCIGQYDYDIDIVNGAASVVVDSLDITPGSSSGDSAVLNLAATANVSVNSAADPLELNADFELFCISGSESCDLWVDPIALDLWVEIVLTIVTDPTTGLRSLDATIGTPTWAWNLNEDDITLTNCFIGDVNDVLDLVGLNILGLVIDQIEPTIDDLFSTLPEDLEPSIEDAFAALTLSQEIDLLGTPLAFSLEPSSIGSQPEGLRIELASTIDTEPHPCVAQYGIHESRATPTPLPAIGDNPPGLGIDPHITAHIDDDFINHVLWGAWYAGLLCLEIDDDSEDLSLPIPVDTGLLGLLAPGVFDDVFPDARPLSIATDPKNPPEVEADGANDINIVADDLGLSFVVELDGRKTRLLGLELDADIGIDLPFDPATGELEIQVGLDAGAITTTAVANEFKPEASEAIEAQFAVLFDSLVGPLLGGAFDGLLFPLPAVGGLGVTDLQARAAGANSDIVGAFITAGPVTYGVAGASCDSGCSGSEGCDSGCSTGSLPAVTWLFPLLIAGVRRRTQ